MLLQIQTRHTDLGPAVHDLWESGITTERGTGPSSCVGTTRKKKIKIGEITKTTSGPEQFLLFYENMNQLWLMNTDPFWIDMLYLL